MPVNPYRQTRRSHQTETAEDYVELIRTLIQERGEARAAEIARRLSVSPVTVNRTLARLMREGLITRERYGEVYLTPAGEAMATASDERHQVVLAFLLALGVPLDVAEVDSEGIEHHVSEVTLQTMRDFVQAQTSGHSPRKTASTREVS